MILRLKFLFKKYREKKILNKIIKNRIEAKKLQNENRKIESKLFKKLEAYRCERRQLMAIAAKRANPKFG